MQYSKRMCGIAGGFTEIRTLQQAEDLKKNLNMLFDLSAKRGRDASGLALYTDQRSLLIKNNLPAKKFLKSSAYQNQLQNLTPQSGQTAFLLQCRLKTSGNPLTDTNNQPQQWRHFTGLHNGLLTGLEGLSINTDSQNDFSDSFKLFELIENKINSAGIENIEQILSETLNRLRGEVNLALYFPQTAKFILATNTGSVYFVHDPQNKAFYFMSEKFQLEYFLKNGAGLAEKTRQSEVRSLPLRHLLTVSLNDFENLTCIPQRPSAPLKSPPADAVSPAARPIWLPVTISRPPLRRCTRCILPETYPFIHFDQQGVCNFCHRHHRQVFHGEAALLKFLEPYRSRNSAPDCLVGLSGGRDSSYGLHLLKTKLGMNPVAYTFDWGLTTDTSRRNQSLMCAELGVEHIIRSADLEQKRSNIQKNVHAFFKKPHLGMVPIFMSGDKEFYEYGRTLRRELGVDLTVFCAGHSLEQRDFFTGFCGVDENIENNKRLFHFTLKNKIRLAFFYASQYALNPAYINRSFQDSVRSFFYSFIHRDDFLYLYEYWPWNEKEIETTLQRYGWQADHAYGTHQWRMGDGQTAFTNSIYLAVAGFTEFDNYRSNQIREGLLTRDEALKAVAEDNRPKRESLQYFADTVGIDLAAVLKQIELIPKLY